jgi:hypothetical protein
METPRGIGMKKFEVDLTITTSVTYTVTADSEDEAVDMAIDKASLADCSCIDDIDVHDIGEL